MITETQISPILNMTFMELIESVAIGVAIGGFFATCVLLYFTYQQTRKRSKTASADLNLRLLDVVRREDFRGIFQKIKNPGVVPDKDIRRILNHYEYISLLDNDGLLDSNHVLHIHGRNIKVLCEDERIKNFLDGVKDEQEFNYKYLKKTYDSIKDKMS